MDNLDLLKWFVLLAGIGTVLAIGAPPIWKSATSTHEERSCDHYTLQASKQLDGIMQCASADDCSLDPADFAEYGRLRTAQGRTCAGLSSGPPKPLWVHSSNPVLQ